MRKEKAMRRFEFRLRGLHGYRKTLEEAAMREYARALGRLEEQERGLRRLMEERERLAVEMEELKARGEKRLELELYTNYMIDLGAFIRERRAKVEEQRKELEIRRAALMEARKDRKVLDVMREQALEEYRADNRRLEQKAMDEMASARFYRGGEDDEG